MSPRLERDALVARPLRNKQGSHRQDANRADDVRCRTGRCGGPLSAFGSPSRDCRVGALRSHSSGSPSPRRMDFSLAFMALAVRLALFIDRYAVNLLYLDEWDFLPGLFDGADAWTLFRWQHGLQRQGLGNLITAVVLEQTGWNGKAVPPRLRPPWSLLVWLVCGLFDECAVGFACGISPSRCCSSRRPALIASSLRRIWPTVRCPRCI